jgi:hypothetical protein
LRLNFFGKVELYCSKTRGQRLGLPYFSCFQYQYHYFHRCQDTVIDIF